jgi:hypothetical protein
MKTTAEKYLEEMKILVSAKQHRMDGAYVRIASHRRLQIGQRFVVVCLFGRKNHIAYVQVDKEDAKAVKALIEAWIAEDFGDRRDAI